MSTERRLLTSEEKGRVKELITLIIPLENELREFQLSCKHPQEKWREAEDGSDGVECGDCTAPIYREIPVRISPDMLSEED
jgi:hypothetical protein